MLYHAEPIVYSITNNGYTIIGYTIRGYNTAMLVSIVIYGISNYGLAYQWLHHELLYHRWQILTNSPSSTVVHTQWGPIIIQLVNDWWMEVWFCYTMLNQLYIP